MKNQGLFSAKNKSKKLKCLLQFLFGALRDNMLIDLFLFFLFFWKLHKDDTLVCHTIWRLHFQATVKLTKSQRRK